MKRRTLLAGTGAVGIAGLSGCLGGVTEHRASTPYGVPDGARSDAGYELRSVEALEIEEPVELGPIEETVVATNYVVQYEKTVDLGPLGEQRGGVFVTLSTPRISVLGQEFNPVAEMDTDQLIGLVQNNYESIDDVEHDEDAELDVLGGTVTRSRYVGTAQFDGTEVEVDLHVTEAIETEEDLVVAVAVYPRQLRDREQEHALGMMGGVAPDVLDPSDVDGGGDGGSDS